MTNYSGSDVRALQMIFDSNLGNQAVLNELLFALWRRRTRSARSLKISVERPIARFDERGGASRIRAENTTICLADGSLSYQPLGVRLTGYFRLSPAGSELWKISWNIVAARPDRRTFQRNGMREKCDAAAILFEFQAFLASAGAQERLSVIVDRIATQNHDLAEKVELAGSHIGVTPGELLSQGASVRPWWLLPNERTQEPESEG